MIVVGVIAYFLIKGVQSCTNSSQASSGSGSFQVLSDNSSNSFQDSSGQSTESLNSDSLKSNECAPSG